MRIHQHLDIEDLSKRLNLGLDDGEKWIVHLIREARMGADRTINLEKVRSVLPFFFLDFPLSSPSAYHRHSFPVFLSFYLCSRDLMLEVY